MIALLTAREVALRCRCSRAQAYRIIRALPVRGVVYPGRRRVTVRSDVLERWLAPRELAAAIACAKNWGGRDRRWHGALLQFAIYFEGRIPE